MKSVALWVTAIGLSLGANGLVRGQTCLSESFTYANGELAGNGGWMGAGPTGRVLIDTNQVKLDFSLGDNGGNASANRTVSCPACITTGQVTVTVYMKRGAANQNQGNVWNLEFNGENGQNMARWFGTGLTALCRNGGVVGTTQNLNDAAFDELKAVINPSTRTTEYFFNGVSTNTITWPAGVGNPTTITTINIVHNNLNNSGGNQQQNSGILFMDDFSIVQCETVPECTSEVSPDGVFSSAPLGGAAIPAAHEFTFTNTSVSTSVNYTAVESDVDGNAVDHAWLSLSGASGPVGPGGEALITANVDATALAAGSYVGFIKVSDDCTPTANTHIVYVLLVVGSNPCFIENFPYPDGLLTGNDAWSATGDANAFLVNNEEVQVIVDSAGGLPTAAATFPGAGCGPCEDGKITITTRVKGAASNGNSSWNLYFEDSNGNQLARWFGSSSSIAPRIQANLLPGVSLTEGAYDTLRMVVDTVANTTTFYHTPNGGGEALVGTLSHGQDVVGQSNVTNTVGDIVIERIGRGVGDGATGIPTVDDIVILGCEGTCYATVNHQTNIYLAWALEGGAVSIPNPLDHTITNTGVESLSYSTAEVDSIGSAFDYGWLSLVNPSGGPLTPDQAGIVSASIDTTGLSTGAQRAYLKFTDDCSPDRTYMRAIKLDVNHCITENFPFADGDLQGNPAWTTDTALGIPSPISVAGGVVRLDGTSTLASVNARHITIDNCPTCASDGVVVVRFKLRGTTDGGGSRFWRLNILPLGSTPLAHWEGSATFVDHASGASSSDLTGGGQFDLLEARINNTAADIGSGDDLVEALSARYFFNGVHVATASGVANGARVRRIILDMDSNASSDANPIVEIDDLIVSRCGPVSELFCRDPVFDTRDQSNSPGSDGFVDGHDLEFGFKPCVTGPTPGPGVFEALSPECQCQDVTGDQAIDINDFGGFQRCYSGPSTPVDPNCDN